MAWALKGTAGPLKDKIFRLTSGMTLGRTAQVQIPDNKASSLHARIAQDAGRWILEDNESKNGTRIKGERVDTIVLEVGLVFFIGDQGFEIVDTSPPQPKLDLDPSPEPTATVVPDPGTAAAAPPPEEPLPAPPPARTPKYWYDLLGRFLNKNAASFNDNLRPVSALTPALVLEFVRGSQIHSHWILGYGPRKLGATSLDLPIYEPGAPAVCFEILPSTEGVIFKTAHPEMVLLNGQSIDRQVLRVGDTIKISETIIEVDFSE